MMQTLSDAGLNPFGAVLLVESLLKHPQPIPVGFFLPVKRQDIPGWEGALIQLTPMASGAQDTPFLLEHFRSARDAIRSHIASKFPVGSLVKTRAIYGVVHGDHDDPEFLPIRFENGNVWDRRVSELEACAPDTVPDWVRRKFEGPGP